MLQSLVVVIGVVEHGLQFHLFLLTWINEQDFCANFECKQFHLLIGKCHRCSHHLAVLEQIANNVC